MFTDLFQLEQKPVTVFSSVDVGAPVLTKDPGSLKTLLKACLVTGYGDKASLGWALKFESEDQKIAAFASTDPTSSKYVMKIDNSVAATAKISAYQSMTSIDVGVKSIVVDNNYLLSAGSWRLIGHGKAFILITDSQTSEAKRAFANPIIFGDLPRQTQRAESLCLLWTGRSAMYQVGGLQSTLFHNTNGTASENYYEGLEYAISYPFVVNSDGVSFNLKDNYCRFTYVSKAIAAPLFEPIFSRLPDSTWTLIPMLQPLSRPVDEVASLMSLGPDAIKAVTGSYLGAKNNADCAIPTNWWYA